MLFIKCLLTNLLLPYLRYTPSLISYRTPSPPRALTIPLTIFPLHFVTLIPAMSTSPSKTYLILGATRGIGHELVRQLLALNQRVIATQRSASTSLKTLLGSYPDSLKILNCDVSKEDSIVEFVREVGGLVENGGFISDKGDGKGLIDTVIFNAGILTHPARVTEL
jgi:hypothetical protein